MALTTPVLADGLQRIAAHMETVADELNALDGQLGDGDLGITMTRGGRALQEIAPTMPADVGMALMACAQAMRGRTEVPWSETASLLRSALDAMMARGKASLGDKTVLDAIDAAAGAAEGKTEPAEILQAAATAVDATLERMRGLQARIGRARIFGERSVGLDDPGMRALREVLRGLGA
jgi:phosphoenolpyruvate---glycerone phosphotransferase subunit DhaL